MKESKYNVFFPKAESNDMYLFNVTTCALAVMTEENFKQFEKEKSTGFCGIDNDLLEKLKYGGFLIGDDVDELSLLRHKLLQTRYGKDALMLTIAPTLACNFRCVYCFESSHEDYTKMTSQTQERIISYIKNQVNRGIRNVSICWYGGEPLMALEVIENICKEILPFFEEKGVIYYSEIITNGYFLTKPVAKKLVKCKVTRAQVTIDGPKDIHDTRRFLAGGQPTFDKIIKNIVASVDVIPRISIRVNLDKDNYGRATEVSQYFKDIKLDDKVHIYPARVDDTNEKYATETCLSSDTFQAVKQIFNADPLAIYPRPVYSSCTADTLSSVTIQPDGSLCKCWSDVGMESKLIGSILPDGTANYDYTADYFKYMLYDATEDEQCKSCLALPMCMGGCPRKRVDGHPRCSDFRDYNHLMEYLKIVSQYLLKGSAESN